MPAVTPIGWKDSRLTHSPTLSEFVYAILIGKLQVSGHNSLSTHWGYLGVLEMNMCPDFHLHKDN